MIQHQKAKHFKCHICNKKLFTGPGLAIHCMQVHKETIDRIPGAVPGRDSVDVEVYGMDGIPQEYDGGGEPQAKMPAMMPQGGGPVPLGAIPPPVSAGAMPYPMPGLMPGYPPQNYYNMFPGQAMMPPMPQGPVPTAMPPIQIRMPTTLPQIPLPPVAQQPMGTFSAYNQPPQQQRPAPVPQANPDEQPSSSLTANWPVVGSKTRIMVPDESISLVSRLPTFLILA